MAAESTSRGQGEYKESTRRVQGEYKESTRRVQGEYKESTRRVQGATKDIRPIALYLPQFHPVKENDEWWGKGFTEWRNVAAAKPRYEGHYQPHLPADLGFYDLRVPEVREEQAKLAKEHGIYGFCYYHYWFNGRRILERPFEEVLQSGKPDFPFMLCWANENWTRIWDGGEKNILLEQNYSEQDDIDHIRSLIPAFKDPRYIRVDSKPVFAIYRSTKLPDVKATLRRWRAEAAKEGLELYLCRFESFGEAGADYMEEGFDAAVKFEPFSPRLTSYMHHNKWKHISNKLSRWYVKYKLASKEKREEMVNLLTGDIQYGDFVDFVKTLPAPNYKVYPCVTPMWDNSPRRKGHYFELKDSTPEKFGEWLDDEIEKFTPFSKQENFVFLNAWNEWAEGNHLEPCQKWGKAYLETLKKILNG